MNRRSPRLCALLGGLALLGFPLSANADFTEYEDSPAKDPNDAEVNPLPSAAPVPWDGAAYASSFPNGVKLVRGSLDASDIDAYAFEFTSGQLVLGALFEDATGERHDTQLGIFTGGAGPALRRDDDGGSGFLSRFGFTVATSGAYEVGVTGFGDDAFDGSHAEAGPGLVPYWLVVAATANPPALTEAEGNDTPWTATPLPPGGGLLGATLSQADVDHFRIDLEAGDRLAISVFDLKDGSFESAEGERNDVEVGVLDPWNVLAAGGRNDDGGPGRMSNLLFTATADGTWTIAVSGFGDDAFTGAHQEEAFDYLLVVARERACPNVVPLISDIVASTPNAYETANLQGGDHYYTDRTDNGRHVLVDVPDSVSCSQWIKTANNDKNVADPSHLGFTLAQDASVFVGYDTRATGEPSWLATGFTPSTDIIDIADPSPSQEFRILRRDFAAGPVTLGGNEAPGAGSNYVVFARPLPLQDPTQALEIPPGVGTVTVTIAGVVVVVVREAGQSDADLAAALAAAVNADPTLAAARIFGLASAATFVTTGVIESSDFTTPVPLLSLPGLSALAALLVCSVLGAARWRSHQEVC